MKVKQMLTGTKLGNNYVSTEVRKVGDFVFNSKKGRYEILVAYLRLH